MVHFSCALDCDRHVSDDSTGARSCNKSKSSTVTSVFALHRSAMERTVSSNPFDTLSSEAISSSMFMGIS